MAYNFLFGNRSHPYPRPLLLWVKYLRKRGQTTVNWSKPKFKFEFNRGHEFRYSDREARVDEFNLLSHFIEKGAVSYMGENLAFQFLQDIGVAAPNTFHMHVRQNGDFYSLASFIEQIDATFLERNDFDPHGPMYKANSPSARSTLAPNPTATHYRKATEKDEPWDDLVEFTNGINDLIPGVTRTEYIFDHVNLPQVINDMAGNIILINHDRLTKNYYMYHDQNGNSQWSRFPWDIFVRQPLLNCAPNLFHGQTAQGSQRGLNAVQRQAPRPDVGVGEVSIHVRPSGLLENRNARFRLSHAPERVAGVVIVIWKSGDGCRNRCRARHRSRAWPVGCRDRCRFR